MAGGSLTTNDSVSCKCICACDAPTHEPRVLPIRFDFSNAIVHNVVYPISDGDTLANAAGDALIPRFTVGFGPGLLPEKDGVTHAIIRTHKTNYGQGVAASWLQHPGLTDQAVIDKRTRFLTYFRAGNRFPIVATEWFVVTDGAALTQIHLKDLMIGGPEADGLFLRFPLRTYGTLEHGANMGAGETREFLVYAPRLKADGTDQFRARLHDHT